MTELASAATSPRLDALELGKTDATEIASSSSSSSIATTTSALPKGRKLPRRPARTQFDSLQELLEEAGYKETRIHTPHSIPKALPPTTAMRTESSSSTATQATVRASDGKMANGGDVAGTSAVPAGDNTAIQQAKNAASSAAWFTMPWSAGAPGPSEERNMQPQKRPDSMRRKASEPSLPRKSSLSRLFSWGKAVQSKGTDTHVADFAPSASTELSQEPQVVDTQAHATDITQAPQEAEASSSRPTLRHADSTHQLWQASMRHHRAATQQQQQKHTLNKSRSFPARLRKTAEDEARQPINAAKLVGAVGMRSSTEDDAPPDGLFLRHSRSRKTDLREAYGSEEAKAEVTSSSATHHDVNKTATQLESSDSVCSIIDSYIHDSKTTLFDHIEHMDRSPVKAPPTTSEEIVKPFQYAAFFFSSAASPVVTRNDAVVMRNAACLDFAELSNPQDSPASAGTTRRPAMRKMSSVGALELALRRMEAHDDEESDEEEQLHELPESGSGDSLKQEDFLNATTTAFEGEDGDLRPRVMSVPVEAGMPQRAPTPTLVITSPTGVNPPQPLVLDGVEFEPRSVSPHAKGNIVLYKPKKRAGWRVTTTGVAPSAVPDERGRSSNTSADAQHELPGKRKSSTRRRKVRATHPRDADGRLSAPTLKRRAGATQSHGDLRGMASLTGTTRSVVHGTGIAGEDLRRNIGKTSGSEGVRELHRSVMGRAGRQPPLAMPKSATLDTSDDEDPFCDPIPMKPSAMLDSANPSDDEEAAWKTSSADSQPARVPLGDISSINDPTLVSDLTSSQEAEMVKPKPVPSKPSKTLTRMRSGVGLACLVDIDPTRAAKDASAANNGRSSRSRRSRNGGRRSSLASMSSASSAETLALGNATKSNGHALGDRSAHSNGSMKRSAGAGAAQKKTASANVKVSSASSALPLASNAGDSDAENRNPHLYDSPTARAASQRNALLKKRSSRSAMPARTAGDPVRRVT